MKEAGEMTGCSHRLVTCQQSHVDVSDNHLSSNNINEIQFWRYIIAFAVNCKTRESLLNGGVGGQLEILLY